MMIYQFLNESFLQFGLALVLNFVTIKQIFTRLYSDARIQYVEALVERIESGKNVKLNYKDNQDGVHQKSSLRNLFAIIMNYLIDVAFIFAIQWMFGTSVHVNLKE